MNLSRCLNLTTRAFLMGCAFFCCDGQIVYSQNQFSIQSFTTRPFVIGVTPVIGAGGAVGGVSVDADGVVGRVDAGDAKELRDAWLRAHQPIAKEVALQTPLRMISLASLDRALAELIDRKQQPSEEMFFLAGLQRVQYVFVVPDRHDVVLAGPAGAWQANAAGEIVSVSAAAPVLRLDDLVDALRTSRQTRETGITCSIEPTEEGLKRYARLKSRRLTFSEAAVKAMEKAIGPQRVILGGIERDSHFARVMVAADYMMKRLAMGFEPSPVGRMPSYLELLKHHPGPARVTSPRWWMTANYEPVLRSPDRLAWQIRGQGVKTLTEDSILDARGERAIPQRPNRLAQQWADTMTTKYDELSVAAPVFGQLRNCIDLAVVGALIANEGLLTVADCELDVLLDASRLQSPKFMVPQSVPSQASLVKGQNGWIVSVSGGVEIDAWSVIDNVQVDKELEATYLKATKLNPEARWWW